MNSFDALLDELFAVADAEGRIGADGEFHAPQKSLLTLLKRMVSSIVRLAGEVKTIRSELAALKAAGAAKPMQKALRPTRRGSIDADVFMAKALAAQTAGRISGTAVAIAEAHINNGKAPPAEIVEAVLAEAA